MSFLLLGAAFAQHIHGAVNADGSTGEPVFQFSNNAFILFPGFAPQNEGEYVGALIFSVTVSIVAYAIGAFKRNRAAQHKLKPGKFNLLERSATQTLHSLFCYLMMLLVMTFNVGIAFAVLFGIFVGSYVFDSERACVSGVSKENVPQNKAKNTIVEIK